MTSSTVLFRGSRGDLYIVAAPEGAQPFPVDAVAEEEDTFLVLSARPVLWKNTPGVPLGKAVSQ